MEKGEGKNKKSPRAPKTASSAPKKTASATSDVGNTSEEPAYSAPSISHIRNKDRRSALHAELVRIKKAEKKKRREKRKREVETLGDAAPPKKKQRTQEDMKEKDDTTVLANDEDVMEDEQVDEFHSYFNSGKAPKVLITTSVGIDKRGKVTKRFVTDLSMLIPNAEYRDRGAVNMKEVVRQANERGFTDILVVNEDRSMPNALLVIHLPNGPTALFKLTSVHIAKDIIGHASSSDHEPEVIATNFTTRLGHSVARMLAALLPQRPNFHGRRVITFHNQRDFIFVRHHRYIFDGPEKARLQEIGPRFTLKLQSLQHGAFDKQGEYEWVRKARLHSLKNKELGAAKRRRFFL